MTVLAIDPGYEQSAYLFYDGTVGTRGIVPNDVLRVMLDLKSGRDAVVVIEHIESFGMAVGREVFETVWWAGRFYEAAYDTGVPVHRLPRKAVKVHLCGSARAQDSNIRVALCDRFGGKANAIGKRKSQGPLFGIKSHEWAALALAVTWHDTHQPADS